MCVFIRTGTLSERNLVSSFSKVGGEHPQVQERTCIGYNNLTHDDTPNFSSSGAGTWILCRLATLNALYNAVLMAMSAGHSVGGPR